jgi:hypothetical protein
VQSKNKIINTTGEVINLSARSLVKSYETWINYLRGVDINNINVPEFQYQLVSFNSSTHDVYLTLIENASLLPMITVKFAEEEGGQNSINEDLKQFLLMKIDQKFSDILKDDDVYHKKTSNRYAVAVLIRGYKDFFKEE